MTDTVLKLGKKIIAPVMWSMNMQQTSISSQKAKINQKKQIEYVVLYILTIIYTNEDEEAYNVLDSDILKTTWEKDEPRITKAGVLANLKKLIGRNIDDLDTDVCEAFEDYDEQGETCMSCEESQDNCTYVASIDVEHSTSFVINCDSDNVIIDVWIQER